jgi:hypothetical protein
MHYNYRHCRWSVWGSRVAEDGGGGGGWRGEGRMDSPILHLFTRSPIRWEGRVGRGPHDPDIFSHRTVPLKQRMGEGITWLNRSLERGLNKKGRIIYLN